MSGNRRSLVIIAALVVGFLLLGFLFDRGLFSYPFLRLGWGLEEEKARVLSTLQDFNAVYSDIFASGGRPITIDAFPATKDVKHEIFRDIGFARNRELVLVYDLANISFVDIRVISHDAAKAVVFEEWNYQYQKKKDRKAWSPLKGTGLGMQYTLTMSNGRWIVSAWDPVPVEDPHRTTAAGAQ